MALAMVALGTWEAMAALAVVEVMKVAVEMVKMMTKDC